MSACTHFQGERSNLLIPPGSGEVSCNQDKPDLWWTKNSSQLRHVADACLLFKLTAVRLNRERLLYICSS